MATGERRRHPRIPIRLPISHRPAESTGHRHDYDFTTDVGPRGVHFFTGGGAPAIGERLAVELSIPPGVGYFPYAGKVRGVATVLRCTPAAQTSLARWSVAARFDRPLDLEF